MSPKTFQNVLKLQKYFTVGLVVVITALSYVFWLVRLDHPKEQLSTSAADCTPTSKLVNPCRPWLSAAAGGYPQVSGGSGSVEQFTFFNRRLNNPNTLNNPLAATTITYKLDIPHVYHTPGQRLFNGSAMAVINNTGLSGVSSAPVLVNWKPGNDWGTTASGGHDADIVASAQAVKNLGSRKIFLTVWHEFDHEKMSKEGINCPTLSAGTVGSAAEYVAMWRRIRGIFDQQGVTNVVWFWNPTGYSPNGGCSYKAAWPGNDYVDWVMWDPYSGEGNFISSIDRFYSWLTANNDATHDFMSKQWGLAEHGSNSTKSGTLNYWSEGITAIKNNRFPKIKLYSAFDTSTNGGVNGGLRVGYDNTGAIDTAEQAAYNEFAKTILTLNTGSNPPPPPPGDTTPPSVSFTEPASGAKVSKVITVAVNASDNVGVKRVQLYVDSALIKDDSDGADGWKSQWDTTKVADGGRTLKAVAYDAAGNTRTVTMAITVANQSTPPPGGGGNTPPPGSGTPAPIIQSPTGQPIANAEAGGTVTQGELVTLDPSTVTDTEKAKLISKVEFYNGPDLIQTITTEPFVLDTKDLKPGTYNLRQLTYFDDGTTAEVSQVVTIKAKPLFASRKVQAVTVASSLIMLGVGGFFAHRVLSNVRAKRRILAGLPYGPGVIDVPSRVIHPTDHKGPS